MSSEIFSRLFCMRPVGDLLAVDVTLIARLLGDETEESVLEALYQMGFHALEKHCLPIQIQYMLKMTACARYVRRPRPLSEQPIDGQLEFNCGTLVQWGVALLGFSMPSTSIEQYFAPVGVFDPKPQNLQPFDIVFTVRGEYGGWSADRLHFSDNPNMFTIGHCGIAISDTQILHAASEQRGVVVDTFDRFLGFKEKPLRGVRRLYPSGELIVTLIVPRRIAISSAAELPVLIRLHKQR